MVLACSLLLTVNDGAILHGHLGTRHEHANTQANAELTGDLHRDRPRTSSRRLGGLTRLSRLSVQPARPQPFEQDNYCILLYL